jgi:hypothetical protein
MTQVVTQASIDIKLLRCNNTLSRLQTLLSPFKHRLDYIHCSISIKLKRISVTPYSNFAWFYRARCVLR